MQMLTETPLLGVLGLGPTEMVIIACMFLLLFGAKRLPQLARSLGRSASEFRRGKAELERELVEADYRDDKTD